MIVFIGGVVAGATGAFFSDTESSYGNTFTAGAVDLTIDSVQHYNGMVCVLIGENYQWVPNTAVSLDENNHPFVLDQNYSAVVWNEANPLAYPKAGTACDGTWPLKNLTSNEVTSDRFFNFDDVKPGDFGENTISIHVHSNDAWMCASLSNVGGDDPLETKTEPELATGDIDTISELPENLYFFAWADDGDNIFEPNNEVDFALGEVTSASELSDGTWALADSTTGNGPIAANGTQYIGVAWCLGEMTVDENTGVITCDGSVVGNEVQTDSFYADISFYVEQARNNAGFECASLVVEPEGPIVVDVQNLDWGFVQETSVGSGQYVAGPSVTPLGSGSAEFTVDSTGGVALMGGASFAGTALSDITNLEYSTYRVSGAPALAIALQFNIDDDLTDANNAWQGRLVYEPYHTKTVNTGVWESWDPMDNDPAGNWWFSNGTLATNTGCSMGDPCTWNEVLAAIPNGGIHSTLGAVVFKAGGGWTGGFIGNMDNFVIGVNSIDTVFDFEN